MGEEEMKEGERADYEGPLNGRVLKNFTFAGSFSHSPENNKEEEQKNLERIVVAARSARSRICGDNLSSDS